MTKKILPSRALGAILGQVSSSRMVRRLAEKKIKKVKMSSKMKRYITMLPSITLMDIDGKPFRDKETNQERVVTHQEFIRDRTIDEAFVSDTPRDPQTVHWTMPMIVAGEAIRMAVRSLKEGEVLELEESDWALLKRATEKGNYALGAASCIDFMRSITNAPMERPRKKQGVEKRGITSETKALPPDEDEEHETETSGDTETRSNPSR